jgi:L-asparaginase II
MPTSETVVSVSRGSLIECYHRGHIVAVNASGKSLYHLGNPSYKTYARSTAKLFQTLPLLESGGADHFGLSTEEIAIVCASHNGEPEHVAAVERIFAKLNIDISLLQCGSHEPKHKETRIKMRENHLQPTALHHNCSGKHAGMLALALHLQSSLSDYISPNHPVQLRMLEMLSELTQIEKHEIVQAVDGCGVPVYGMNINKLALAFARFGSQQGLPKEKAEACRRIISAVTQHPFYLAGSQRFDTRLIEITKGRIIGKMGAEGIYGVTIPTSSMGIVVKIEDGAERALYPTVIETLKQLYLLNESELIQLTDFHTQWVHNNRGEIVGQIKPEFKLKKN